MTREEIEDLFSFTERKNNDLNLRGILLYSEGNFFQVLEGEKKELLEVWRKIQEDPRHYGIIQVIGRDIERKALDGYKAEIVTESTKINTGIPTEYIDTIKGISPDMERIITGMLKNFINTRSFRAFDMDELSEKE